MVAFTNKRNGCLSNRLCEHPPMTRELKRLGHERDTDRTIESDS